MNGKCAFYNEFIAPHFRTYAIPLKTFLFIRWLRTPYQSFVDYLPETGTCVDLGCGHGLLAITVALKKKRLSVTGIDHDKTRLAWWEAARNRPPNLSFICESLPDFISNIQRVEGYSALLAIDVLHYFAYQKQESMIQSIASGIRNRGVFIMREIDPESGVASGFNYIYEQVATRIGFTKGENVFLRPVDGWRSVLERHFKVKVIPCASFPFSDVLFVCEKKAA